MKKFITLLLFVVSISVFASSNEPVMKIYDWPITRVVDGDTIEFVANWLPPPLKPKLLLRVYGVDTPEKGGRAKCTEEALLGAAATKFAKKAITESKTARVAIAEWDKFGGRVLGDIILDNNVSLRALLIQNGYAREYYGDAKKPWCRLKAPKLGT